MFLPYVSGGETTVMYYLNDGMYGSFHDDYVLQNMQQEDRTPLIINSQVKAIGITCIAWQVLDARAIDTSAV